MGAGARLEIQNLTPYAIDWVHREREDAAPDERRENLLREAIGPFRGRLLEGLAALRGRLVCAFDLGGRAEPFGDQLRDRVRDLLDDDAVVVRIRLDARDGFTVEVADARVYRDGAGGGREWTGRYRWESVPGRFERKT